MLKLVQNAPIPNQQTHPGSVFLFLNRCPGLYPLWNEDSENVK